MNAVKFRLVNFWALWHGLRVKRTIYLYAAGLAGVAFALQWIEYQYLTKVFATEFYIVLIGIGFTGLGLWLGRALAPVARMPGFMLNQAALSALRITKREHAVLEQIASGKSNKQIAETLHVSPNTIKTHVSRLYEKLDVSQRVQAVQKAKELQLIP